MPLDRSCGSRSILTGRRETLYFFHEITCLLAVTKSPEWLATQVAPAPAVAFRKLSSVLPPSALP